MIGEPDRDEAREASADQHELGRSKEVLADERFARAEAFMARYRATFEALAKQDGAADLETLRQIELGDEIMDEYGETFSALAKPTD
ncbi:hypothetical protein [Caulobacter sp. UNC279MFTsu5.1]|uniref:hypothetical protein n=1 Tax=Caulobacter sp. UNC279MFTsu5.1 TaxID=1502775 RepID=UPI00037C62D1|nr:hypothetical protein [Caulobacter sp. UNC279MFTsu5.1]SFI68963.1 hypothetical protein SAMN02799626_00354 [Caulobacter sp. UNC279MFTsu5.1]